MSPRPWPCRLRGFLAVALLAAGSTALFEHHHADHDGALRHVEEDHGSHGMAVAPAPDQLPAAAQAAVPVVAARPALLPDLPVLVTRAIPEPNRAALPASGRDPPAALGSRAPPA